MPLPQLEYYALDMLPERWGISIEQIQHYIETGKLFCCIWLKHAPVIMGHIKRQHNGREVFCAQEDCWTKGFVRVIPEDCRWVFRDGQTQASCFMSIQVPGLFLQLKQDQPERTIKRQDLVILYEQLAVFEQCYFQIQQMKGNPFLPVKPGHFFKHSEDYQTVELNGMKFRFGMTQAHIIGQLHKASKTSQPWVHGKILLSNAGARSVQVKNVFSSQKQWRKMIESDRRGYYRLNI